MSLDNLVGKTLEKATPDRATIGRLLTSAGHGIADAQVEGISAETRFDSAYRSIMQLANAALQANGFRTLKSRPGHHQTMIQTLGKTIGLDRERIIVLDGLRSQRNVVDYSGDIVPDSALRECVLQAESLLRAVQHWLEENKPELLKAWAGRNTLE